MRSGMAWLPRLAVACATGTLTALLVAATCLMANLDRRSLPTETWFERGRRPWIVAQHQGLGTWWVNASRSHAPLLGQVPEDFRPPSWALQCWGPLDASPEGARAAALAGGWPLPALARGWVVHDAKAMFPASAEFDVSGAIMDAARERMGDSGWRDLRLLPGGLLVDALPWAAVTLWLLRRRTRRGAVSPPAASAR
ncbi:MAG: hypothetical protein ACO32J_02310 [Phycisphaerales bacterium]